MYVTTNVCLEVVSIIAILVHLSMLKQGNLFHVEWVCDNAVQTSFTDLSYLFALFLITFI